MQTPAHSGAGITSEKLSVFQKQVLTRWINSADIWDTKIVIDNLVDELKTGVLLCNVLKFHQTNLDFAGLNLAVRSRKPCLNNLEKAIQVMCQKGVPTRYVLTAEEIFDGQKVERIWLMMKQIFEVFAMHDMKMLKAQIIGWLSSIVQFFDHRHQFDMTVNWKSEEFYNQIKTGLPIFYVLLLYTQQPSAQQMPLLDASRIYEIPQSRQELKENLTYVVQMQYHLNIPIYLMPEDYIDRFQPNFVLLMLYYHYVRFSHVKISLTQTPPRLTFRDSERTAALGSNLMSFAPHNADFEDDQLGLMGVIEEEDSVDFTSSVRSKNVHTGHQRSEADNSQVST